MHAATGIHPPPALSEVAVIPEEIFSVRPDRRSGPGLVQQTVQIAAALRLRDLTLVVRLGSEFSNLLATAAPFSGLLAGVK